MNVGRGLYQITAIGIAALFFIVVMKLLMAKYPIPGLSEVVAMA